ncbi:MAG: hypothetical protein BV456_05945 [Thermoplasmata archaeon M8B2D]|nr:MAG: hypothetical protein BV456_05945 [Thermoplasmata archaeon M8B2D]
MQNETGALAKDKMLKLARMELHGVPRKQTAMAMGLSEGRISQIMETAEYASAAEIIAAENFDKNEMINKGWDGIEALGIRKVVEVLQNDPDPDFALRAATLANKASRRGGFSQNPISQNVGVRAIINLNANFVEKLQQNFEITKDRTSILVEKQKDSNFLGAKAVQELLQIKSKKEDQDLLAGTSF